MDAPDVLKAVRGVKFDAKMQKSGFASFALKEIALQDKDGNIISNLKEINAIQAPKKAVGKALLSQNGKSVHFEQVGNQAKLRIYDLKGNLLASKTVSGTGDIALDALAPASGLYVLRLSTATHSQFLKIQK